MKLTNSDIRNFGDYSGSGLKSADLLPSPSLRKKKLPSPSLRKKKLDAMLREIDRLQARTGYKPPVKGNARWLAAEARLARSKQRRLQERQLSALMASLGSLPTQPVEMRLFASPPRPKKVPGKIFTRKPIPMRREVRRPGLRPKRLLRRAARR